jgi:ribosome-associated protein
MKVSTILHTLEEHKAKDIQVLSVSQWTPFVDTLVICTATSSRHAKSLGEYLIKEAKLCKTPPLGVEGLSLGEWVLVNLDEVVAHIMLPETRELYQLEQLWG